MQFRFFYYINADLLGEARNGEGEGECMLGLEREREQEAGKAQKGEKKTQFRLLWLLPNCLSKQPR